jgi:pimeloyl-ACP methyl ester carboxylesterase
LALAVGVAALCALGAAYQAAASAMDRRNHLPPGQMVDVGGRRLHLRCSGPAAGPTVLLEHGGGGAGTLAWYLIQPEIARTTRACAYDRAGLGWSEPGPLPRDGRQIAGELHELLREAGVPGPYVLAGWSYGGLFVRAYAAEYPDEVAGLALLDATHPDVWSRTPAGQAQYRQDSQVYAAARGLVRLGLLRLIPTPLNASPASLPPDLLPAWRAVTSTTQFWDAVQAESAAIGETMAQVRAAPPLPAGLPVIVVTAGANTGADGRWAEYQGELAALSGNSAHVVVPGAGHIALWADPQVAPRTAAAILRVVDAARTGGDLNDLGQ